jgi:hypothetical protein
LQFIAYIDCVKEIRKFSFQETKKVLFKKDTSCDGHIYRYFVLMQLFFIIFKCVIVQSLHEMTWEMGIICSRAVVLVWEEMVSAAIVANIEAGVTEVTVFVVVWYVVLCYVKYKTVRTSVRTLDNL